MKFLTAWIMSILGIVILGTVVDLLLHKSRVKNIIRSVFATVSILIIVTPLPSLISNGPNIDWNDIMNEFEYDDNFLDYIDNEKISIMEKALIAAFESEGIKGLKIEITADTEGNDLIIKRITIDLSNSVMNCDSVNINKYEFIKEKGADAYRKLIERSESDNAYRLESIAAKYDLDEDEERVRGILRNYLPR